MNIVPILDKLVELEKRISRLECDTHSPMPYIICPDCNCLVHQEHYKQHKPTINFKCESTRLHQ